MSGEAGLAYLPADSPFVALIEVDPDDEQLNRLARLIAPAFQGEDGGTRPADADSLLRELVGEGEDDRPGYDDVRPLLDDATLVYGITTPARLRSGGTRAVAVVTTDGNGGRIGELLEGFGARKRGEHRGADLYDGIAVDGDSLVFAFGEDRELRAAIDRRRDEIGIDAQVIGDRLPSGSDDPLLQAFGDLTSLKSDPQARGALELPWIRALDGFGAWLELQEDAVAAEAVVHTDPVGLKESDLPLAPGGEAPLVPRITGALSAANREQRQTTLFLSRLARAMFPTSEFVREVEALERDLGIGFEGEVLAQFDQPSVSMLHRDGSFAAVSRLSDPERMRRLLPRIAPRLPRILRALRKLGRRGLIPLLMIAPDAPLTPSTLGALLHGIRVVAVKGEADAELYRIEGLQEDGDDVFATDEAVFGMIGDRFVVASSALQARRIAAQRLAPLDGAKGTAVARADLGDFDLQRRGLFFLETVELGEAVAELEASLSGLSGRLRIDVPGGLD